MGLTSHFHTTILQTVCVIVSTSKFVHQILVLLPGNHLLLWKLIFFLDWFYFSTSYFILAIFFYLFLCFCIEIVFFILNRSVFVWVFLSLLKLVENLVSIIAIDRTFVAIERTFTFRCIDCLCTRAHIRPDRRSSAMRLCDRSHLYYDRTHLQVSTLLNFTLDQLVPALERFNTVSTNKLETAMYSFWLFFFLLLFIFICLFLVPVFYFIYLLFLIFISFCLFYFMLNGYCFMWEVAC